LEAGFPVWEHRFCFVFTNFQTYFMHPRRVVVTGLGALTPIGNSVSEYWENLEKGTSGAAPITRFDTSLYKVKFACEVKDFAYEHLIPKSESKRMDLFSIYALYAAHEAMLDSGLDVSTIDRFRAGVVWSSGIGGIITFQEEVEGYLRNNRNPRFNPFFIPKMIIDLSAGHISMKYGLMGPNYCTVSACASSTNAIIDAFNLVRWGKADFMVTGGAEAAVTEVGVGGFMAMRALSERNDSPQTASRPFDQTRDGFVLGEGAGALILEELGHAQARGAKIYAEIAGAGMTADAYHLTAPHPEGIGVQRVMLDAIHDAELSPQDIDYINVHGTSTPLGDVAEIKAIQKVFQDHAYQLNISSTKSMTGHLLGAAGAIEAIATVASVHRGFIPPTINHTTQDPEIDPKLNLTLNKVQYRDVNAALSNTFGFGGHNACVLIKKFKP
jgi:3-oxoacyl-[acyl-carrier-protein] synthase II